MKAALGLESMMESRRGSPQRACAKLGRTKAMVPAAGGGAIAVPDGSGSGVGKVFREGVRGPRT